MMMKNDITSDTTDSRFARNYTSSLRVSTSWKETREETAREFREDLLLNAELHLKKSINYIYINNATTATPRTKRCTNRNNLFDLQKSCQQRNSNSASVCREIKMTEKNVTLIY
jgi:hypothetical protein